MRVYVPTTLAGLEALRSDGFAAPVRANAVTPALREWYAEGDLEELEYAAADDAARASLRLLASAPGDDARRVVVAADVPDAAVRPLTVDVSDDARSAVEVSVPVTRSDAASVHVDDVAAVPDVRAAVAALPAADAGDEDASFTVDGADGHELLWFDVTELDDVLDA